MIKYATMVLFTMDYHSEFDSLKSLRKKRDEYLGFTQGNLLFIILLRIVRKGNKVIYRLAGPD